MAIAIRPYRSSDLESLRRMTVEGFEGVSIDHAIDAAFGPLAVEGWRERKARHVDDDAAAVHGLIAVAEDIETGLAVGYVSMRLDREAAVGRIPNLAVSSGHQGRGLGRRLLEHALEVFRREGMRIARIETLESNPVGRHLYPSVGFVEVARQIHYAMPLEPDPGSPR